MRAKGAPVATEETKSETSGEQNKAQARVKGRESAGSKALVIVESPAKAKTINKYLGGGYVVKASVGHVRDLPERGLGVEIDRGFAPTYELVPGRRKVVSELKKLAERAPAVYLATDLDREGEAIAWHLAQALDLDESKIRRVIFNEITRSAIQEAFSHPRHIDMDKVNAQQARRILDRIVGYELSPLLWKKVAKGLSAGRVQSVALRLIVEREKEIKDFIPSEYWDIGAYFARDPAEGERLEPMWREFLSGGEKERTLKEMGEWLAQHSAFGATMVALDGRPFKPTGSYDAAAGADRAFVSAVGQAREAAEALGVRIERQNEVPWPEYEHRGLRKVTLAGRLDRQQAPAFTVTDVQKRRALTKPSPPFTTATLQQAASSHLHLSASRTMRLAQELYEGIELAGEDGPVALITYMRTDSTNLSAESVKAAREWISENCGRRYLPDEPNVYASGKRAQEAHEAIRPTDVTRTPESLKGHLAAPLQKLYELIWRRFVACQMTPAEWDSTTVLIQAKTVLGEAEFRATGRTLAFDGFYKVMGIPHSTVEQSLPDLTPGQVVGPIEIKPAQRFTSPPPRYTEASLVKRMEAEGIGRPSTYAAIIQTMLDRGYVEEVDRRLFATDKGTIVTDKLVAHFPDVMDVKFTSFMEDELDKIEEAHLDWNQVLHEFYDPFHTDLVRAHEEMEAAKAEPSPYKCELCGGDMVYRWGRTGRFLSCGKYPKCKGAFNIDRQGRPIRPQVVSTKCEKCGKDMVLRQSRHGSFLGCSGYPECTNTIPCDQTGQPLRLVKETEIEEPCPECGVGTLKVRGRGIKTFLGCDQYPRCKVTKPLPEGVRLERKAQPAVEAGVTCERCGRPMLIRKGRRGEFVACSGFPRCRNTKPIEELAKLKTEAGTTTSDAHAADPASGDVSSKPARRTRRAAEPGAGDSKAISEGKGSPPPGFAWTRTGKLVIETWPEVPLSCPECGRPLQLKSGRFGPFFSCSNFPQCRCSVNLRGEAKKRAEIEMPPPPRPKPVPTDIVCEECGEPMMIRSGRSGKFLGCSKYPKCRNTKPVPSELLLGVKSS
ncbi:MAG TPA: type I DNA topoisomerase [Phycisphaerae bacterium]|nr:type I DNA topoisomerase [Phycisphaerae bacterium]HRR86349.1 type I DNA topoisomerase [Phycisphaerae bacterium]